MSATLSGEARARLDKHLDAVEAALVAAGNSREQRRAVLDDLEAQILDMLATKSQTPTAEDVETVSAQLDPPAAYIPNAAPSIVPPKIPAPSPVVRPRYSRTAIWGLACIVASLVPLLFAISFELFTSASWHASSPPADLKTNADFMAMLHAKQLDAVAVRNDGEAYMLIGTVRGTPDQMSANEPARQITTEIFASTLDGEGMKGLADAAREGDAQLTFLPDRRFQSNSHLAGGLPCFACLIGPLGLLGTVLGWIAFFQIRALRGALRGTGLALFDGLFYPCLAVLAIIVSLLLEPHVTYTRHATTRATVSAIVISRSE